MKTRPKPRRDNFALVVWQGVCIILIPGRWTRLERYARFRSNRLRLERLPDDVFALVVSFLDDTAVCHLACAFAGGDAVVMWDPTDVARVPCELRAAWMLASSMKHFEATCTSLAERALFHVCFDIAGGPRQAFAAVDWTPFSPHDAHLRTVAEFAWRDREGTPQACVYTHRATMLREIQACLRDERPSVRISVHAYMQWSRREFIFPRPLFVHTCTLFPPFLLEPTWEAVSCRAQTA